MTQFGYPSSTTSPARQRIEAAGRAFSFARADRMRLETEAKLAAAEKDLLEEKAKLAEVRRLRALNRIEEAIRLVKQPSMAEIIANICKKHRLPLRLLQSAEQSRAIVRARWEAYYLCFYQAAKSKSEIGRFFRKDHTTVMYGIRQHKKLMEEGDVG